MTAPTEQLGVSRRGEAVVLTVFRPDGSVAAEVEVAPAVARQLAAMLRAATEVLLTEGSELPARKEGPRG